MCESEQPILMLAETEKYFVFWAEKMKMGVHRQTLSIFKSEVHGIFTIFTFNMQKTKTKKKQQQQKNNKKKATTTTTKKQFGMRKIRNIG